MKSVFILVHGLCAQLSLGAIVTFSPPQPLFMAESVDSTSFPLDIDNNGLDDFRFGGSSQQGSVFRTERANRTLTTFVNPPNATGSTGSIPEGSIIGGMPVAGLEWMSTSRDGFTEPGPDSGGFDALVLCLSTGCLGEFFSLQNNRSFIGVEFEGDDGIHYGFFDVEYGGNAVVGRIHGWAYESEIDAPITTFFIPEPSSTLLIGMTGLFAVNRRKRRDA